jgi:3-oxoacyl-[acyl-carrier-protein] synthase-3
LRYAHVVGWGKAVPEGILTNHDLEAIVDTSDDWIQERTGIQERRIAAEGETTADLALRAAQRALEVANILPTDVDLIIVATSTPEHIFPSTASLVQDRLGASHAGAYDLSAACSGFVYALDQAAAKIRTGDIDIAVVIGAETMSRLMNWSDRTTCILFGDGAGAFVLQGRNEPGGVLSSVLRSDGAGWDMLGVPTVGSRESYLPAKADQIDDTSARPAYELHRLHMNGREVYRFATRVVPESIRQACEIAEIAVEDLAMVVPHQANQRIIETIAKQLKLPEERVFSNVAHYGNTSAASIPIAMVEAIEAGKIKPGDHVAFVGFGGGLTWASMVIRWDVTESEFTQLMQLRRNIIYRYAIWRRGIIRYWRRFLRLVFGESSRKAALENLQRRLEDHEW